MRSVHLWKFILSLHNKHDLACGTASASLITSEDLRTVSCGCSKQMQKSTLRAYVYICYM